MNIDAYRILMLRKLEYRLRSKHSVFDNEELLPVLRDIIYDGYLIGSTISSLLQIQVIRNFGKTEFLELKVNENGDIINE